MERERRSALQHEKRKHKSIFSGNPYLKSLIDLPLKLIKKGE
jgi:hypothetical protein